MINVQPKNSKLALLVLMLIVIIEVMGLGLVLPILPGLFIAKSSPILGLTTGINLRHFFYGLYLSVFPIGMFFGTPFLGELSDKFGRKKILLLCLLAVALCYFFSVVAIHIHSLTIFLLVRIFSGFFSGSYDIANAATADISTTETKARNMGWISLALALGFIVGPIISSFTTEEKYISWFNLSTPFLIAGIFALVNALLVAVAFKETFVPRQVARMHLRKVFSAFVFIYNDPRVRKLGLLFFVMSLAWWVFLAAVPLVLSEKFHQETHTIGMFMIMIGIGNVITVLFIQKTVLKLFTLKQIVFYSLVIAGVIVVIMGLTNRVQLIWMLTFIFAVIEILSYGSFLALTSNAVSKSEQGKVMGGIAAVASIAFFLTGFMVSELANINILLPIFLSAIAYFVGAVLL